MAEDQAASLRTEFTFIFRLCFSPFPSVQPSASWKKHCLNTHKYCQWKKKRSWNSKSTINKKGSGFCSGQTHPIQRVPTKAGTCICGGTHQIKDNIWYTLLQVWILFLKRCGKKRIFLKLTSPRGTVSQCKCIGLPTVNMAHRAATTTKTICLLTNARSARWYLCTQISVLAP